MNDENFLLVTPPGWVEIPNATVIIDSTTGESEANAIIARGGFIEFDNHLETFGQLPTGKTVVNARLFNTAGSQPEDRLRLWVIFE